MFNLFVRHIRLLLKTPKRALTLFVCLKWLFGEADYAHTLIPDDYWIIFVADLSTKHSNWMQQSDRKREGNLDQPEKKSYSQTEKNFQFFQNGGEMYRCYKQKKNSTIFRVLSDATLLCYCCSLCRHSESTNQTMQFGKKYEPPLKKALYW